MSLAPLRRFVVTGVELRPDAQVLSVGYQPVPTISYEGATITLYAAHHFDAPSFLTAARPSVVGHHVVYFGLYQHMFSVAWPVHGGRWVCLSGFIGSGNGGDPAVSRTEELAVATGVVVR